MQQIKCQTCGAECAEGTVFCRQCGAPINVDSQPLGSEQTTTLLDQAAVVATQRLESRATGPDRGRLPQPAEELASPVPAKKTASRRAILIGALVLVVVGVICVATLIGMRSHRVATNGLFYPGAKTVVDMMGSGGSRTLHLETSDPFNRVEDWYQKALKPEKTVRLTANSVVLKNDKMTATIAADSDNTNILIKVNP